MNGPAPGARSGSHSLVGRGQRVGWATGRLRSQARTVHSPDVCPVQRDAFKVGLHEEAAAAGRARQTQSAHHISNVVYFTINPASWISSSPPGTKKFIR